MSDNKIQSAKKPSKNLELFASVARFLSITEGLSVHTCYRFKDRDNFEDAEICSYSFGGNEVEDLFSDSDIKRLEKLLDDLSAAGLATNSSYVIEEESRDEEGDYQITWDFEIPLIENFREPAYLNETRDSLLNQSLELTGFESRIHNFYQYGLQQVAALLSCKHKFNDKDSYSEMCIKCDREIWDPSEFIEKFQNSDIQDQRVGLLQRIQNTYLKIRCLFKR